MITGLRGLIVISVGAAAAAASLLVEGYRAVQQAVVAGGSWRYGGRSLEEIGAPLGGQKTTPTFGALRLVGIPTVVRMERAWQLAADRDHELCNGSPADEGRGRLSTSNTSCSNGGQDLDAGGSGLGLASTGAW